MYQRKTHGWSRHLDFMAWDILTLELALFTAFMTWSRFVKQATWSIFWGLLLFLPFVDLSLMLAMDTYEKVIRRGDFHELTKLLPQVAYLALVIGIYLIFAEPDPGEARYIFCMTTLLYFLLCFGIRYLWKRRIRSRIHMHTQPGMLIVAMQTRLESVLSDLSKYNLGHYHFTGAALLDEDITSLTETEQSITLSSDASRAQTVPIVATRSELINYLSRNWVDEVYIDAPGALPIALLNQIMEMGITVHTGIGNMDRVIARNKNIEWICGQATITTSLGYVSGRDLFLKRLMDIIGGIIGCILTGIVILFIGPVIYLSSPGPIIFRQTRIGENGRRFQMYKFRSMYPDAESRKQELMKDDPDNLMFKMKHDPRIIGMKQRKNGTWKRGIGGFIRDTSLDELPQFWNILKGEMSLVGTRPPTVDEWEKYKPAYRARMSTRPGLTGLWQISGRSTVRDFEKVVQLDREYIENWSLMLDIKILLKTVKVVFSRHGAM